MTENAWSGSQIAEREDSKGGTLSNLCLAMESQNIENSVMTCAEGDKVTDHSNRDQSPPSYDNKSAYSSVVGAFILSSFCLFIFFASAYSIYQKML